MIKKGKLLTAWLWILVIFSFHMGCSSEKSNPTVTEAEETSQQEVKMEKQQEETPIVSSPVVKETEKHTPAPAVQTQEQPKADPTIKEQPSATPKDKQEAKPSQSIQSTEQKDKPKQTATTSTPPSVPVAGSQNAEEKKQTVSLSIIGDQEHGTILAVQEVSIAEGDSVLDVLKRVIKEKKLQMEYKGSGGAAYVEGIDNLYEFDKGPKSGWMYRVNGQFAKQSAGSYRIRPGDKIDWLYTLDMGKDLGEQVSP